MPTSAPTAENLRNSGYLLRGWLSVKKIAEVKRTVLDGFRRPLLNRRHPTIRKPAGEAMRVPVTRDTWFSNVGTEADCNLGGSTQLKLKSNQEMSLIDIDPKPLRGRVIKGATLHMHLAGEERLYRDYRQQFRRRVGRGHIAQLCPAEGQLNPPASPPSECAVDRAGQRSVQRDARRGRDAVAHGRCVSAGRARLAAASPSIPPSSPSRVAGISYGFLLFDDTGSEWTRDGEQVYLPSLSQSLHPQPRIRSGDGPVSDDLPGSGG